MQHEEEEGGVTTVRPWNGDFARSNVATRMHAFANNYCNDQRFDDCARLMASGRFLFPSPRVLSRLPAGLVLPRLCHENRTGEELFLARGGGMVAQILRRDVIIV